VIVAVSGGQDSVALIAILSFLRPTLDIQLSLAYFDHQLRGRKETAGDLTFVQSLAKQVGYPFAAAGGDVRAYAKEHRLSIEDAGRRLRYAFLRDQARLIGATVIATGHTASDQAETVLMRIIRGTGLDGLKAMVPRAAWPFEGLGPDLVRPLLSVDRADTEFYCRGLGISPRDDHSNRLLDATRNRVRHQVLPLLRELNPRVDEALVRLARYAEGYASYVDRQASGVWPLVATETPNQISFRRNDFDRLESSLRSRLLILAFRRLAGESGEIGGVHIDRALSLTPKRNWRMSLPGGLRLLAGTSNIRLIAGDDTLPKTIGETKLSVPGRTRSNGWIVSVEHLPAPKGPPCSSPGVALLDASKIGDQLTVRSRRPGDRLRPLGLGGEKKLQDILVDAKVPREERDGVPLLCAPWGIAWVVGHCIDERAALTPATTKYLRIRMRRSPDSH